MTLAVPTLAIPGAAAANESDLKSFVISVERLTAYLSSHSRGGRCYVRFVLRRAGRRIARCRFDGRLALCSTDFNLYVLQCDLGADLSLCYLFTSGRGGDDYRAHAKQLRKILGVDGVDLPQLANALNQFFGGYETIADRFNRPRLHMRSGAQDIFDLI